jgi:hypothetical protein
MSQVPCTFIVDSIWLKISSLFPLKLALCMAMSYGPQIPQVNEEPAPESSLDLTLTQHLHDENLEPQEVHVQLEADPP